MRNFGGSAFAVTGIPSNMGGVADQTPLIQAGDPRCVLIHAGMGEPPPRLQRAFEAKKITSEVASDVFNALARICALTSQEGVALPILAIVEPEKVQHAADLFEAASVYAPKAVLWVYSSEPHEQIREVRESDLALWRSAQTLASGEHVTAPGRIGDGIAVKADGGDGSDKNDPRLGGESGAILTDEELEMLLADDIPDGTFETEPDRGDGTPTDGRDEGR